MEGNNKKKKTSFITKANNFLDNYGGYIAAGICGITLAVGYYVKGYTYDVKCDQDEELENEFPNVMNLWRANSFWARMKKSKFEEVMKTPIELYVTREVIPKLYHNSVTQNVKVYLSKSGFLEQDKSIVGQVLSELSKSSSIDIDPPQSLTNRFFKLFVPNEDGFITKEEFVKKFYLLTKARSNQKEILQIIFDMLDVGQNKYLTFNSFFEIFNEFAVLFSEFSPRLLRQIRIQIRDIIIEKIYDRFDQYIPLNDIPEEKFTIITSEFSHKNSLSFDITSILIPDSFEKIQEIFKDQSRFKNINNLKQRVLDIQEFRNCMSKIFNYPLIAEKIISFTLGNLSEEDSLFTIDKQDFETYKNDCIEEIKNNADQISNFLWEIINSNGDEYLTENEFDTFFSFLYSLQEVVEEKIEEENPLSTLTKSYKGIFLAKESGSDLSNAHRLTRLLKYRNEKDISGKKLNNFINSLLSFFCSFLDTLVKSMTTKSSVEKQVSSWIKRTFQTEEPQNIKIDFEQFNDKLGETICTSISKFISKLK